MNNKPALLSVRLSSQTLADTLNWFTVLFAAPPTPQFVASHRRGRGGRMLWTLASQTRDLRRVVEPCFARRSTASMTTRQSPRGWIGATACCSTELAVPTPSPPYESAFMPRRSMSARQAPTGEMDALLAGHDLSVLAGEPRCRPIISRRTRIDGAVVAGGRRRDGCGNASNACRTGFPAFAGACAAADDEGFWAAPRRSCSGCRPAKSAALQTTKDRSKRMKEVFHVHAKEDELRAELSRGVHS